MMASLYNGLLGMKTHSTGLQSVSNNISNVNTVGYKKQHTIFEGMISEYYPIGSTESQGSNQIGKGVRVGSNRIIHTQGGFEPGSSVTDLAISGKGFFQVTSGDKTHYTRAGNFRFNVNGFLQDPGGFTLMGVKLPSTVAPKQETLEPIKIDIKDPAIAQSPPRKTTSLEAAINLGDTTDNAPSENNPYFGMLEKWNGTANPPMPANSHSYAQPLRVYDEAGIAHDLTVYFDGAPSYSSGINVFEYTVVMDPSEDASPAAGTEAAGLLMSGTMSFSRTGALMDMTAFTPSGPGASKDLNTWTPATLVNGVPQFTANFVGSPNPQPLTLDFGISSSNNTWGKIPSSAAAIGVDSTNLPSMMPVSVDSVNSTARKGSSSTRKYFQDGSAPGDLQDITVTSEGVVQGIYSNNDVIDFYQIPLAIFTSEDGLRGEGGNHYSSTFASGEMKFGLPGKENFGKLAVQQLETSNVDMSVEMVNLIIMQRGFQMNSKSVTTADSMLQKALELKRN